MRNERVFCSLTEAAQYLGFESLTPIHRAIRLGNLRLYEVSGRPRIKISDLVELPQQVQPLVISKTTATKRRPTKDVPRLRVRRETLRCK